MPILPLYIDIPAIRLNRVTNNTVAVNGNTYLCDTTSSSLTLTLPRPVQNHMIIVKDVGGNFSSNNVLIGRFGSEKIEGIASSYALTGDYSSTVFMSDGTDWFTFFISGAPGAAGPAVTFPIIAPGGSAGIPDYAFAGGGDDTGFGSQSVGYLNFINDGASTGFISPTGIWNIGGPTALPNRIHKIFRDTVPGSGHSVGLDIGNQDLDQGKMRFSFLNAGASGSPNIAWQFLPRKNDDTGAFDGSLVRFEKVSGENTVNFRFDLYENATGPYQFMSIVHVGGEPILKFNPDSTFIADFEITQGSVNNALVLSGSPGLLGGAISLHSPSGGNGNRTIFRNNSAISAAFTGLGNLDLNFELRLLDSGANYVGFVAPAVGTVSGTYTLPVSFPGSDKVLQSDNAGVLTWITPASPTITGTANTFAIFNNSGNLASYPFWTSNDTTGETTVDVTASGTNLNVFDFQIDGSLTGDLVINTHNITTTVGSNFIFINAAMSGNVGGNYQGISQQNSGSVTGSMTMLSLNNAGNVGSDLRAIGIVNTATANNFSLYYGTHSGNITGNSFGLDLSMTGDATNKRLLNLTSSSGSVTDWRGIELSSGGSASSTAIGINISMSGISSPNQKIGLSVNDGALSVTSPFDTSVINASPGFFSMNTLGGQYHIASGDPTTNSLIIGNNLGVHLVAEDDMGPDAFLGNLGFIMNGFISQVVVADTKTVDAFNFMFAAGSVPTGVVPTDGGTITDLFFFRAVGLLPSGGNVVVNNAYGFRVDSLFSGSGFVTNAWGIYVEDTGADNWFAKNVVIGGATGQPTGAYELDVTGNAIISGDLASATLTPGNGASGTFTTTDLKTVTVLNGIVTSIV